MTQCSFLSERFDQVRKSHVTPPQVTFRKISAHRPHTALFASFHHLEPHCVVFWAENVYHEEQAACLRSVTPSPPSLSSSSSSSSSPPSRSTASAQFRGFVIVRVGKHACSVGLFAVFRCLLRAGQTLRYGWHGFCYHLCLGTSNHTSSPRDPVLGNIPLLSLTPLTSSSPSVAR